MKINSNDFRVGGGDKVSLKKVADKGRFRVDLAKHLHGNGTRIIKYFLRLSWEGQRKQLSCEHRRARQKLEIQPRRHSGEKILEAGT
jgi:hypothetical protein